MKKLLSILALLALAPVAARAQAYGETRQQYDSRAYAEQQQAQQRNAQPATPGRTGTRFPGLIPLAVSGRKRDEWQREKQRRQVAKENKRALRNAAR